MSKKVVLITPGQPSVNPRLVKEADALAEAGYNVTVLYAYWNQWATKHDEQLLAQKKWKAIRVGGDPEQRPLAYLASRIRLKLANYLFKIFPGAWISGTTIARAARALNREAPKHKADIYIAHNLGALAAAVKAAKKQHAKCGFDAEDFHRHDTGDSVNDPHYLKSKLVEDKYLPQVDYITAASPLIAATYKELYPQLNPVTVRNVFPVDKSVLFKKHSGNLKLLWFSQNIGRKRGLEDAIGALQLLNNDKIELHLLGHLSDAVKRDYMDGLLAKNNTVNIHFHEPIPAEKLIAFASEFDIGLALEPGLSINNRLVLTNKVFTYPHAGLAILASNMPAQKELLKQYPAIGRLYEAGDAASLSEAIKFYFDHRDELLAAREVAFSLSQTELNWENESQKFLSVVAHTLNKQ